MLFSIQILRAVAAAAVVGHHVALKISRTFYGGEGDIFFVGNAGVDLFFVISGFVMCLSSDGKTVTAGKFLVERAARILPVYWIVTVFALIVYIVSPDKVNASGGVTGVVESFFLVPSGVRFLVQNGWTLSYEFLFYIIFAAALCFGLRFRYLLLMVVMSLLAAAGYVANFSGVYLKFLTSPLLIEFVFGVFAYLIYKKFNGNRWFSICALLFFSISMSLIFMARESYDEREVFFGVPALSALLFSLSLEPYFSRFRLNRPFRVLASLGDSSYSLYLIHPFVLVLVVMSIKSISRHFSSIEIAGVMMALCLISGFLFYKIVETPVVHRARTLARRLDFADRRTSLGS
jgi:exopolysaccharide production protein ExoZ